MKNRVTILIIGILFIIADLLYVIFNALNAYNIILLTIVYIPFVLIAYLNKGLLGKVLVIGFGALNTMGMIFGLVITIRNSFYYEETMEIVRYFIEVAIGITLWVLMIISAFKVLKEKDNKGLNIVVFIFFVLYVLVQGVDIVITENAILKEGFVVFQTPEGEYLLKHQILPFIKETLLSALLVSYLIYASQKKEEQPLLEKEESLWYYK